MFDHLVDLTEPICQNLDSALASMTIFDTSGIEAWVTENDRKYANRIIKQLKAFKKSHNLNDSYDPYKAAYHKLYRTFRPLHLHNYHKLLLPNVQDKEQLSRLMMCQM